MFTINDPGRIGYLSQGIGTGLASALEGLAQHKTDEVRRKRQEQANLAAGFSPELSRSLPDHSEDIQKEYHKVRASQLNQESPSQPGATVLNPELQKAVNVRTKPFLDSRAKSAETKAELKSHIQNVLERINDPDVSLGYLWRTRGPLRSKSDELLDTEFEEIPNLIAALTPGNRSTNERYRGIKAAKVSRQNSKEVITEKLNQMLDALQSDEFTDKAQNELIMNNGGQIPVNLQEKSYRLGEKLYKQHLKDVKELQKLPDYRDFAKEALQTEKETGFPYAYIEKGKTYYWTSEGWTKDYEKAKDSVGEYDGE